MPNIQSMVWTNCQNSPPNRRAAAPPSRRTAAEPPYTITNAWHPSRQRTYIIYSQYQYFRLTHWMQFVWNTNTFKNVCEFTMIYKIRVRFKGMLIAAFVCPDFTWQEILCILDIPLPQTKHSALYIYS